MSDYLIGKEVQELRARIEKLEERLGDLSAPAPDESESERGAQDITYAVTTFTSAMFYLRRQGDVPNRANFLHMDTSYSAKLKFVSNLNVTHQFNGQSVTLAGVVYECIGPARLPPGGAARFFFFSSDTLPNGKYYIGISAGNDSNSLGSNTYSEEAERKSNG
jgi:hypothetical protein